MNLHTPHLPTRISKKLLQQVLRLFDAQAKTAIYERHGRFQSMIPTFKTRGLTNRFCFLVKDHNDVEISVAGTARIEWKRDRHDNVRVASFRIIEADHNVNELKYCGRHARCFQNVVYRYVNPFNAIDAKPYVPQHGQEGV